MLRCFLRRIIVPTINGPCRLLYPLAYASVSPSLSLSTLGDPLMRWPSPSLPELDPSVLNLPFHTPQPPLPPMYGGVEESEDDVAAAAAAASIIAQLLRTTTDTSHLDSALLRCGVAPSAPVVAALLRAGDLPSAVLLAVYHWARPQLNPALLVSFVDRLAKSRAFDSAWSLLIEDAPSPLSAFAALFRRYARANMPSAAIRVFEYVRRHPEAVSPQVEDGNAFELLVDALCKEGHPRAAAEFLDRTRKEASTAASVPVYNMLLHGWFRSRNIRRAERLWDQMRRDIVHLMLAPLAPFLTGASGGASLDPAHRALLQ